VRTIVGSPTPAGEARAVVDIGDVRPSARGSFIAAESGYFRAKFAQKKLVKESSIPYSIVQVTQFFEFLGTVDGDLGRVDVPLAQAVQGA
jgi:uncharacterized protein YbjT (DUF2867 family)